MCNYLWLGYYERLKVQIRSGMVFIYTGVSDVMVWI